MTHTLKSLIVSFFHKHLCDQCGCSPNTVQSYCECIRLLIQFCCREQSICADALDLEAINEETILRFLDSLEKERGNQARTRNQRLAAIKSFYRYLAQQEPTLLAACTRICAIRSKKTEHKVIKPLSGNEIKAILEAVPLNTVWGLRDHALIMLMYNTGARVQELADLKIRDIRTNRCPQVKLTGKGGKERVIPLWEETAETLRKWINAREENGLKSESVFTNRGCRRLTRFGIAHILTKYTDAAAERCPSLLSKKVTPHTLRHTTALYLIQSNVDITVARDWLGHADIRTTSLYIEINTEMKRKALKQCPPPATQKDEQALWHQPKVLKLLQSISSCNYVE